MTGAGAVVIGVLVVDDHPAVRAGLVDLLRSEPGLSCLATAGSAGAGIDAARRTEPAVVLVDYELPNRDGLTLCTELKALPQAPGVVVYSAFARPGLLPAAAVAGVDSMLDKAGPPRSSSRRSAWLREGRAGYRRRHPRS